MEDNDAEKKAKARYFSNRSQDKKFLLTNYFQDLKNPNKKNMIENKIKSYIKAINEGINSIQKDDLLNDFYSKFFAEYYSLNEASNEKQNSKKLNTELPPINLDKKNFIQKSLIKFTNEHINRLSKPIAFIKYQNYNNLNKTFNISKIKDNKDDINNIEKINKYNKSRQSISYLLNNFAKTEDKDFYIKDYNLNKSIYNITEEGKIIEKKLINKEKKKYFSGFKNKYNGLMRKNKKILIDINEYINGKGGKKNNMRNNLINKYKIVKIGSVLKQIDRKIKKINQKEKMKDIIQDIKRFKEKEIIIQDRFRKTDEKFNNLISNSDMIKKRILKKFNNNFYY